MSCVLLHIVDINMLKGVNIHVVSFMSSNDHPLVKNLKATVRHIDL